MLTRRRRKWVTAMAVAAMLLTTLSPAMRASALEGEGETYTGNATLIGNYPTSGYYGNTAFRVTYRYDSFDKDGTYVNEDGKVETINYNDTFQFLVYDTAWHGWDKTTAGPGGVDVSALLTADDLNTTTTYTATVPIATIESKLSTGDSPYGINLQLGGVGDTRVTVETISYVSGGTEEGEAVTITGSWQKGIGGKMTVADGSAYVAAGADNINVYNFSTKGFINPTVDVTVTYDKSPDNYVEANLENQDGSDLEPYFPYIDVTGTYTYTTEIPENLNAFLAVYDACKVTEIRIYDNHEGNALNVSGQTAQETIAAMQPSFVLGDAMDIADEEGNVDETATGNPLVTEKLFQTIQKQGFKSVKIPISYLNMVNSEGDINDAYLDRIQKVVDDALDTGMYVVINIHNDGGTYITGKWLDISLTNGSAEFDAVVAKFRNMWTELATRFASYNQALIFEDVNELMVGDEAYEREDLTDEEFENAYANITELNQAFVDAVRGTGSAANQDRCLVVPGYNANIDMTVAGFEERVFDMPDDSSTDRQILSVHYYDPPAFTLGGDYGNTPNWNIDDEDNGKPHMIEQFDKIAAYGVPVYLDEYSAAFKNNIPTVTQYVGALNASAKQVSETSGVAFSTAYWSNGVIDVDYKNGTGLIDRRFNIVTDDGLDIINIIKANFN